MNIRIKQAAQTIITGGIIAYPTEAVWGFGCDPFDQKAVERLLAIKQRKPAKGLILVAGSVDQVKPLLRQLDSERIKEVLESWPGPNTWIIPAAGLIPEWITGVHNTVAIRVSSHPMVQALCNTVGHVIVSTSANRAGKPVATSAIQIRARFGQQLDYILAGKTSGLTQPSQIRDALTGERFR